MDYRKIIKFGRSAHVVSLPQPWLQQHHLQKGDTLFVETIGNQILFSTEKEQEIPEEVATILVTEHEKNAILARKLISAYENNATTIIFTGKKLSLHAKTIHELTTLFSALEVIEHTKEKIICKTYINTKDIEISSFIRRMDNGAKSIMKDLCEEIFDQKNLLLLQEDITEREKNIDKITRLLRRVIKERLYTQSQKKEDAITLLRYWQTIVYVEEVCDLLEEISYLLIAPHTLAERKIVKKHLLQTKELFEKAMNIFYTKQNQKAHFLADDIKASNQALEKELKNKEHSEILNSISQIRYLVQEINKINY